MASVEIPRQIPGKLPVLFAKMNVVRARELISELEQTSQEEKIRFAVDFFTRLVETDQPMRSQRAWSAEFFKATQKGPEAQRQFLIDSQVFYGDGEYLYRPPVIMPGMEIANLTPTTCPGVSEADLEKITNWMFLEYFKVKHVLSFPEWADLLAWLGQKPLLGRLINSAKLSSPRLKESFLLKDYVDLTLQEAKKERGEPLIAIFGCGKGEELVPLTQHGFSVVCFDLHDRKMLEKLFQTTFRQAGVCCPKIVDLDYLSDWRQEGCQPTIFIQAKTDFANHELPSEFKGLARTAAAVYVLHEIPDKSKTTFIQNMVTVAEGSVVIVDGKPSVDALDNMVLPISQLVGTPITGHDAVVTHLLCLKPEEVRAVTHQAAPDLAWTINNQMGPPLPPPLFYRQQVAAVGRRQN